MRLASRTGKPLLAISGGVGGAKLCLGLDRELAQGQLHAVVNTGDDFRHLGLHISPDIDTLLYTLSGRADPEQGWGLESESWQVMTALQELGGETWFRLGDRDLATHLWRTQRLAEGASLSQVTAQLARRFGLLSQVLPVSDEPLRTLVQSDEGELPFQHYFVRRRCEPVMTGFRFEGLGQARLAPGVEQLLETCDLAAVIICPSNPFVSVDPVLQVAGLWQRLRDVAAPVIAVSPIVAGAAIKGPAAKMMAELAMPVSALGVAQHYAARYPGLLDHFVIDDSDVTLASDIEQTGLAVAAAQTIMKTTEDKRRLARFLMKLAGY